MTRLLFIIGGTRIEWITSEHCILYGIQQFYFLLKLFASTSESKDRFSQVAVVFAIEEPSFEVFLCDHCTIGRIRQFFEVQACWHGILFWKYFVDLGVLHEIEACIIQMHRFIFTVCAPWTLKRKQFQHSSEQLVVIFCLCLFES